MTPEAPSGPGLILEVRTGPGAGSRLAVEEELLIGRGFPGTGRLADDPELSRHHAQVVRRPDGTYVIEDLGSTNGTILNGERVTGRMALAAGDEIALGASILLVSSPAPAGPPPVADAAARSPDGATEENANAGGEPPPAVPAIDLTLVVHPGGGAEVRLGGARPARIVLRDGRWVAEDG